MVFLFDFIFVQIFICLLQSPTAGTSLYCLHFFAYAFVAWTLIGYFHHGGYLTLLWLSLFFVAGVFVKYIWGKNDAFQSVGEYHFNGGMDSSLAV